MTDSNYESARRCPRCDQPGEEGVSRRIDPGPGVTRGARLHMFYCRNERCRWFNTPWTVQINPDGSIPPAIERRERQFPSLPDGVGDRVVRNLQRQLDAETQPGAEIR